MNGLGIQERQRHGIVIIDVEGEITNGEPSRKLSEALRMLIVESKRRIIINLAKVKVIDTSALDAIIAGGLFVKENKGELKIVNLNSSIADLTTVRRLHTAFELYESEDEGIYSFEDDDARRIRQPLNENFDAERVAKSSIY